MHPGSRSGKRLQASFVHHAGTKIPSATTISRSTRLAVPSWCCSHSSMKTPHSCRNSTGTGYNYTPTNPVWPCYLVCLIIHPVHYREHEAWLEEQLKLAKEREVTHIVIFQVWTLLSSSFFRFIRFLSQRH